MKAYRLSPHYIFALGTKSVHSNYMKNAQSVLLLLGGRTDGQKKSLIDWRPPSEPRGQGLSVL